MCILHANAMLMMVSHALLAFHFVETQSTEFMPHSANTSPGNGPRVKKKVSSEKLRLVFMLGLEGSGHHYIMGTNTRMREAYPDLPKIEAEFPVNNFFIPWTMSTSSSVFVSSIENARHDMRGLAQLAENIPFPGTVHFMSGGLSFPCAHGIHKVMQYPDPRMIAEAAETEGVDLRVLYLKRGAKDLLLADTVHRGFQNYLSDTKASPERKFMEYVRILFTDIAVVHSFLGELDPAFVVCHDWEHLGDKQQAKGIAEFVAPNADVAAMVEESLVSSVELRRPANESLEFDATNDLTDRLQLKLDAFEYRYCR